MIVEEQKYEILREEDPMKHIERIARVCYKSEHKICNNSAKKMIKALYDNKHMAMLEHYRFIMEVGESMYNALEQLELKHFEFTCSGRFLVSCNARSLINMVDEDSNADNHGILPISMSYFRNELIGNIVKHYDCYELFGLDRNHPPVLSYGVNFIENKREAMSANEFIKHGWMSCKFITDRGVSHELVRHRLASFAQESTRYCNYNKDKFNNEITVVNPFCGKESYDVHMIWERLCKDAERAYFELLSCDVKPQIARSVLPTSLKTEIVVTANIEEWLHIFELRSIGTTGKPHPMMKNIMDTLFREMIIEWYIKNDGENKITIGGDWMYGK